MSVGRDQGRRLISTARNKASGSGADPERRRGRVTPLRVVPDLGPVPLGSPIEDDDALALACSGDERGFVVLYRTVQPLLLRYLQVRSPEEAEDVASESWLQVVRDLGSFTGDADDFRGWVFTIARHRAIDAARARSARPSTPVADPDPGVFAPSAESVVVERDDTRTALAMVAALPPDQAEMVMLRVVAGLDVAAVAELVGKNPGTVRVAVHRALKTLRSQVDT